MAGNIVRELNANLTTLTDELTILTHSIKNSFNSQNFENKDISNLSMKKDIREFKIHADSYDRQFEEEESRLQAYGGKSRKQTLQEFILLFFFVTYGILTVALVLYANKVGMSSMSIIAVMAFSLLIITSIIVSYA